MDTFQFGTTAQNLPVIGYKLGHIGPEVLLLGGVHGDETEGVIGAFGVLQKLAESYTLPLNLTIVPQFNLDGTLTLTRCNSRGVDLNRNLPTKDWTKEYTQSKYYPGVEPGSEPENKALIQWIDINKPRIIYSLHSWKPMINMNGQCQPEADVIASHTGYIVNSDIGYPTPGSLGTYAGMERDIPTITYEIERGLVASSILEIHVPALLEALKVSSQRFR